jgi:hypothetical protein
MLSGTGAKEAEMDLRTRLYAYTQFRLLCRALIDRNRSREHPERGRFTRRDVKRILADAAARIPELASGIPSEPTPGARLMLRSGVWSLAMYHAIRATGAEADHATELCTDYLWTSYRRNVRRARWHGHLRHRDPEKQMARIQERFLRFPLESPGYDCRLEEVPGCYAYDIRRCPVQDYFRKQGDEALEFFRRSWCTLDYPLAEHLVRGGRYTRSKVLSDGDAMCDMRWSVERDIDDATRASR